jgi:hypothetical protein
MMSEPDMMPRASSPNVMMSVYYTNQSRCQSNTVRYAVKNVVARTTPKISAVPDTTTMFSFRAWTSWAVVSAGVWPAGGSGGLADVPDILLS